MVLKKPASAGFLLLIEIALGRLLTVRQQSQRREGQSRSKVIRGKMRIAHRHLDIAVTKDLLQRQDVAARHHVVAGEGVAQNVG
jgi:hypothetical protein